jgi:hypothetical protein
LTGEATSAELSRMNHLRFFAPGVLVLTAASLLACGDDESATTSTSTSSSSAAGTTTTATGTGSGGGGTGGAGGATGSGGSGGTGGASACDALAAGPFEPVLMHDVLSGSEDLAFDGKGHIAAKDGTKVVLVDAAGSVTDLASSVAAAYGLRYRPDGSLVVALFNDGKVVAVSPEGVVSDLATGLPGVNGLYPDFDGSVYATDFSKITRIDSQGAQAVVASGSDTSNVNGIVLDARRGVLFYTDYGAGRIRRIPMAGGEKTEIAQIDGANLDGLVLDACGHVYAVDQGNSRLYRQQLDAAGSAVGEPELLADFPSNVANAQFGSGEGYDPTTLYAAGNPGDVYAVAVGVPGAPVPTPP